MVACMMEVRCRAARLGPSPLLPCRVTSSHPISPTLERVFPVPLPSGLMDPQSRLCMTQQDG